MPTSWTCPFCNQPTTVTKQDINDSNYIYLFSETEYGDVGFRWTSVRCPNLDCREVWLKVSFDEVEFYGGSSQFKSTRQLQTWTLRPESSAKPQPDYIPEQIREDYYEACLIAGKSPKASATLSRRCLQGMIRDFWNIKEKNLFEEINALEGEVDGNTWKAIKAVKDIGNIGAHMEKDINLIIPVEPDEAQLLIDMIELLIEDWYKQRHRREQTTGLLVQKAQEKKELRDQNPDV